MRFLAGLGVALCVVGALMLGVVPGGLWSDLPGSVLLVLGFTIEAGCTVVILAQRARGNREV